MTTEEPTCKADNSAMPIRVEVKAVGHFDWKDTIVELQPEKCIDTEDLIPILRPLKS